MLGRTQATKVRVIEMKETNKDQHVHGHGQKKNMTEGTSMVKALLGI